MHNWHKTLFVTILSTCLSFLAPVQAKPNNLSFIQCPLEMDGRIWKPINYSIETQWGIVRYLPENQVAETWGEMVSTQWHENMNMDPKAYYSVFLKGLRDLMPNSRIKDTVFYKSNLSLIAEWTSETNGQSQLYGLVKIFAFNPNIYLLTYTTREQARISYAKQTWLPIMRKATLNYAALEKEEL